MKVYTVTSAITFLFVSGFVVPAGGLYVPSVAAAEDKSYKMYEAQYDDDYVSCYYSDPAEPAGPGSDLAERAERRAAKEIFMAACMQDKGYRERDIFKTENLDSATEIDFDELKRQREKGSENTAQRAAEGSSVNKVSEPEDN